MNIIDPRRAWGQLLAYVLILIVALFGFLELSEHNKHICDTARDNRNASRNIVIAVDELGRALVDDGKPHDQLTPEEQHAIEIIEDFREDQLDLLKEPVCEGSDD